MLGIEINFHNVIESYRKCIVCSYNILDQLKLKSGIRVSFFIFVFAFKKLNTKGSFLIHCQHTASTQFYFPFRIFISVLNFSHSSAPHTNVLATSKNTRTTFYGRKLKVLYNSHYQQH